MVVLAKASATFFSSFFSSSTGFFDATAGAGDSVLVEEGELELVAAGGV